MVEEDRRCVLVHLDDEAGRKPLASTPSLHTSTCFQRLCRLSAAHRLTWCTGTMPRRWTELGRCWRDDRADRRAAFRGPFCGGGHRRDPRHRTLGGRIGGVLGTIPTTSFPPASDWRWPPMSSLARVWPWCPMACSSTAVSCWSTCSCRPACPAMEAGTVLTTTTALLVWSAFGALVLLTLDPLLLRAAPMTLGLVGTLALAVMGVLAARGPRPAPAGHRSPGSIEIMARGLAAGTAIGLAVYLSGSGCPCLPACPPCSRPFS